MIVFDISLLELVRDSLDNTVAVPYFDVTVGLSGLPSLWTRTVNSAVPYGNNRWGNAHQGWPLGVYIDRYACQVSLNYGKNRQ